MALNTDFKVKDSLYVGNSACFVSQTNTPVILSAGSSLFDIFLQEGEVATNCSLTDGIGIADFTYDGSAAVAISADFTEVVRTSTDQTIAGTKSFSGVIDACTPSSGGAILSGGTDLATIFTTCVGDITNVTAAAGLSGGGSSGDVSVGIDAATAANFSCQGTFNTATAGLSGSGANVGIDSGTLTPYQEAKDWCDTYGSNVVLSGSSGSQGTLTLTDVDNTTLDIDLGLQTGDNVQFTNICGTGTLDIDGNADFNGQILSAGSNLFDIFSEGDITEVIAGTGLTGGGSAGSVTLNVSAGDGVEATANCVSVDNTVVRTTGTQSIDGCKTFTNSAVSFSNTVCVGERITHSGDPNTAIVFATDNVNHCAGGVTFLTLEEDPTNQDQLVVNELGSDVDFIVRDDTTAALIYTDAVESKVGIGTDIGSDGEKLTVAGSVSAQDDFKGESFIKRGGTSSQFLKADGSVDSTTYFDTAGAGLSSSGGTVGIDAATAADFSCQGIVTCISNGTAITVTNCDTANPTVGVTTACDNAWNAAYTWCNTYGNNVVLSGSSGEQGTLTLTDVDNTTLDVDLGLQTGDSPVFFGLSAITLSGDGQCITGVTATPTFPSTIEATGLTSTDKIFINDSATCDTSGNKHVTYTQVLTSITTADASNTGLEVDGNNIRVTGIDTISDNTLLNWTGSTFEDSMVSEDAAGNTLTIGGSAVIQGDLTVDGTFTCLNTQVTVTSAFEICNCGTGPALYAEQEGANCAIACFVDAEGGTIIFDDGGNVGIGCDTPGQKLVVSGDACITCDTDIDGNLTVDGNTTLGDAATDTVTVNACGITFGNSLASGTTNDVVILDGSDLIRCRAIDSRVWGSSLVDGSGTTNFIPIWSDGNTVGNSPLSSTCGTTTVGEDLSVNGDVSVNAGNAFDVYATGNSIYSSEKTFTATVGTGGTTVATFAKSGFDAGKYVVTLINGVNKTVFEVLVTYNGTDSFGTVYGIVDAQAASQLDTIDVSNASSTIDLVITSASASTTAIIHGKAFY